jgi:hypothetical protein
MQPRCTTLAVEEHNRFCCRVVDMQNRRSLNLTQFYLLDRHFFFVYQPAQHELLLACNAVVFLWSASTHL